MLKSIYKSIYLTFLITFLITNVYAEDFPLSIVHINDFHARFEATDTSGGTCDAGENCIGGYARTVFTVKRLLEEHKDYNPVYFNAGDSFQGTLWYNIGRWNVTSQFLNMLPADAMTLGNHEFDHGVEGVAPFLENVQTKMLVANMDSINEPTLTGKYMNSTIITKSDRKIGIIGVILETTYDLANTGDLIFYNESLSILEEAEKLKKEGANIIIVISHCGYDVDKLIATHAGAEIDVIVGAHSHTFLYTGDTPPGPDTPRGDYPTVITHQTGHRVLIVQAAAYAKYVGYLRVYFDELGNVTNWEGAPIYMGIDVPEDEETLIALQPWKEMIDKEGTVVIGFNKVELQKSTCSSGECNLGNFFCDAMIHAFLTQSDYDSDDWATVAIGMVNTGALRVPLQKGNITYSHMVTMSPFENQIVSFNLPGDKLLQALEFSVQQIDLDNGITTSSIFLQVSGLRITYNFKNPIGERVVDLKVRCAACKTPMYEEFDKQKIYRIAMPDFLANGGDGFSMFRDYSTDTKVVMTDLDALVLYTKNVNPITVGIEKRITVLKS